MPTSPTNARPCAKCRQFVVPIATSEPAPPPHHCVLRCPTPGCGQHMGFGKKPDNDATKYRRPARHKNLADKFGEDFCEMCLLKCSEFPPGDVLHAHHVDPYHEGGDATKDNLWMLCTCCHRLVEFQRRYRGQSIQAMRAKGAGDAS